MIRQIQPQIQIYKELINSSFIEVQKSIQSSGILDTYSKMIRIVTPMLDDFKQASKILQTVSQNYKSIFQSMGIIAKQQLLFNLINEKKIKFPYPYSNETLISISKIEISEGDLRRDLIDRLQR